MIKHKILFGALSRAGIDFFTGVPDSLLKDFCSYISDHVPPDRHVIASNEGGAIALAAGRYLATGKAALVYMQNSGLGNAVNPLVSLADKKVYGIPMLIFIGWRGEPGVKDEPQHMKQGEVTPALLKAMGIPYVILSRSSANELTDIIKKASGYLKKENAPYVLLVKKNTFEPYAPKNRHNPPYSVSREEAINLIVENLGHNDIIVATTGKTSRELFERRKLLGHGNGRDFLAVGSMGHASMIALGVALSKPRRRVYCLDGDGALIMHMGHLPIIGQAAPKNFRHIVLNNESHDSVGGQPTAGSVSRFTQIALACGYAHVSSARGKGDVVRKILETKKGNGPSFLEIKVKKGSRENLGRPTRSPAENKKDFMLFVSK